jgi:hypothetical protein
LTNTGTFFTRTVQWNEIKVVEDRIDAQSWHQGLL